MLRDTSNASQGSRNFSPHGRSIARGGIKKRRSGPARVDKDGDLVMDSVAAGRGGGNNNRHGGKGRINQQSVARPIVSGHINGGLAQRSKSGIHRAQQAIIRGLGTQPEDLFQSRIPSGASYLEVIGILSSKVASNQDGGLNNLLTFLERKASNLDPNAKRQIKIKKSSQKGDSVFITASTEDIEKIQKLDRCQFAGAVLSIKPANSLSPRSNDREEKEGISAEAQSTKEKLRTFIESRYIADMKLLDLSGLGTDPVLQEMGIFSGGLKTAGKLFPAIMVICDAIFGNRKAKQEAVHSIALTDNALTNIEHISKLSQSFPDIQNLDLSRNKIADLKDLDAWHSKFRSLEILLLNENPIEDNLPELKGEILRRWPRLHTINNVQVRTPEEINAIIAGAEHARTPIPICGPDFRDEGQITENFIRHFLNYYDANRELLVAGTYDSESIFSLSINTSAPRSAEVNAPVHNWSAYLKHSRNLDKITHLPARMNRQYKGVQNISAIWKSLPATIHPNIDFEGHKYLIETHAVPGIPDPLGQSPAGVNGMLITMHGEFEEPLNSTPEHKYLRSFSRTFILGPGAPGGPQIRVVSDMLVLRAWALLASPTTTFVAPVQSQPVALKEPQPTTVLTPEQQQIVAMQLMNETRMKLEYCGLCLEQAEWDLQKAYQMFTQKKDSLPPDAFVGVGQ